MSKLNFLVSIPHTSTHQAMIFLGMLHTQVSTVSIGETGNGIVKSLLDDHITESKLTEVIKALRMVYPDPPYKQRDIVPLLLDHTNRKFLANSFDEKYKYLFYYSHLVPDFYNKEFWPQDIIERKISRGETNMFIFSPLRDPIVTSLSIHLLTGDVGIDYNNFNPPDFPGLSPYMWWTIDQFQTLVKWKQHFGDRMKFLPVDLYNRLLVEDRLVRSTKLIRSMGLAPKEDWENMVRTWKRANPFHAEVIKDYKDQTRMLSYLMLKNELEQEHELTHFGKNDPLVQYLIEKYRMVSGLQELFEAEGYTNLCWFK